MESFDLIFSSPWYWLSAAILLIVSEAFLPGMLMLWIGFGAAAVGVFLAIWPGAPLSFQLIAFASFTVISVLAGLKYQLRSKRGKGASNLNTGLATYAGRHVIAVENFQSGRGRVTVSDTFYTAVSNDPIVGGQTVVVNQVGDGVFHVSAIEGAPDI